MGLECLAQLSCTKRCVQALKQLSKHCEGLHIEQGSDAVAATQFLVVVFVVQGAS